MNCSHGECIRPNTEPVPNAFMAAPPRHPFFAHVIRQLPKARSRLFHGRNASHPNAATGPTFLSTSLMHWARHEKGAGVNIRPNPVIYNHPWAKRRHTCGHAVHNAYEQPPKVARPLSPTVPKEYTMPRRHASHDALPLNACLGRWSGSTSSHFCTVLTALTDPHPRVLAGAARPLQHVREPAAHGGNDHLLDAFVGRRQAVQAEQNLPANHCPR